jgi:hypothetical protein
MFDATTPARQGSVNHVVRRLPRRFAVAWKRQTGPRVLGGQARTGHPTGGARRARGTFGAGAERVSAERGPAV